MARVVGAYGRGTPSCAAACHGATPSGATSAATALRRVVSMRCARLAVGYNGFWAGRQAVGLAWGGARALCPEEDAPEVAARVISFERELSAPRDLWRCASPPH